MKRVCLFWLTFFCFAFCDPCGMVPPIYTGDGPAITRIGLQKTYVFYKDGIETVVIRPGFSGKVDQFGMLIPFPAVPSLRKVPDDIFAHIAASVDPPEVLLDLIPRVYAAKQSALKYKSTKNNLVFRKRGVQVLKQEAVGMYEVTVLQAGSAAALKEWMDQHGYRYPGGMDKACNDYVELGWCFVAVKTRVGQKQGVTPRPGMRNVNSKLPRGANFDGHVQGMGFRFYTDKMVVPMRLSTFNGNNFRNIVYIMTDKPCSIDSIPKQFVKRQISGETLYANLTQLLPVRVIGGDHLSKTELQSHLDRIKHQRNPKPKNGLAAELYASDLLAVMKKQLSHEHEEAEKMLLRISENLQLRGKDIDKLHNDIIAQKRQKIVNEALSQIKTMTLTVVDGDFPREVIAKQNLTFTKYTMPTDKNTFFFYDAKKHGPNKSSRGKRIDHRTMKNSSVGNVWVLIGGLILMIFLSLKKRFVSAICIIIVTVIAAPNLQAEDDTNIFKLIEQLSDAKQVSQAVEKLVAKGEPAINYLLGEAVEGHDMVRRGWAIVCLTRIGGDRVDAHLNNMVANSKHPKLVRTWALAGRIQLAKSMDDLSQMAFLLNQFPAVERPMSMRVVDYMAQNQDVSAEKLLSVVNKIPKLSKTLAKPIMGLGAKPLAEAMRSSHDQGVRRLAAAYLGSLAASNNRVPYVVAAAYKFDPEATQVSWSGGALFVPGLRWDKESGQTLVSNLISWYLWCERMGKKAEQRQIHNNIRSLQLASAAGYRSPGWQEAGTDQWLLIWGKTVGKKELQRMLKEQGVHQEQRYVNILNQLGE